MTECEQMIDQCLFRDPRNPWEREELRKIKEAYKFMFKDQRGIDAFCNLVYMYRKEIGKRNLLKAEYENPA